MIYKINLYSFFIFKNKIVYINIKKNNFFLYTLMINNTSEKNLKCKTSRCNTER